MCWPLQGGGGGWRPWGCHLSHQWSAPVYSPAPVCTSAPSPRVSLFTAAFFTSYRSSSSSPFSVRGPQDTSDQCKSDENADSSSVYVQSKRRALHPSHWIRMCHYLYVLRISTHTHMNTCILYRIKNVPWLNERLTIYFFYVFKGEPSSDMYRKCCNDMKIKKNLAVCKLFNN